VEEFALLLLDANPPRRLPKGKGPQRRRDDRVDMGEPPKGGESAPRAD
jgi:hypothetical protein